MDLNKHGLVRRRSVVVTPLATPASAGLSPNENQTEGQSTAVEPPVKRPPSWHMPSTIAVPHSPEEPFPADNSGLRSLDPSGDALTVIKEMIPKIDAENSEQISDNVKQLLDKFDFSHLSSPEQLKEAHDCFVAAIPQKVHRRGTSISDLRNIMKRNGYEPLNTEDTGVPAYRKNISDYIVERYEKVIGEVTGTKDFLTENISSADRRSRLLTNMLASIKNKEHPLDSEACDKLLQYMEKIDKKMLAKDFSIASDDEGIREEHNESYLLKDIHNALKSKQPLSSRLGAFGRLF